MSDEIINFYKKSSTNEVDVNESIPVQEPVIEQIESKPLDPFENFLQTLAVNIEKTKAYEPSKTEEMVSESTEEDPFAKFLTNVADIIKKDEKVQTDEQIKEATIGFINKLKEEPAIEEKPVITKKQKNSYLPKKFIKKLPKKAIKETAVVKTEIPTIDLNTGLPESIQDVKEEVIPETDNNTDNTYVKELKTIDKSKKIPDKVTKPGDIKALIEKQVREQVNKLRQELGQTAMTAGGGGTVAVQYADGGTMNGDLNVTGKYLSGGRDLTTIFSGGGGSSDRLISGTEELILNSDGSVTFPDNVIRPTEDAIITLESENTALSAFTRVALSPYAFFAYDSNSNSITFDSIDNSIVLTSQDQYEWTFNDKGELIGPSNVLTVNSTLSTLSRILSGGRDLADIFLTSETDSQTLTFNVSTLELSISNGNSVSLSALSSTGIPADQLPINSLVVSNSANWNEAYNISTEYQNASSSFATNNLIQGVSALLTPLSLTSTLTGQLVLNSTLNELSSNWQSGYETVTTLSGNWNSAYTSVRDTSANWNEAYNNSTVYANNSASYATTDYVVSNYFPLSGGIVTGETHFNGNVTVFGNLTATGTTTFANTIFSVTSALSVVHVGSGPAMFVGNDGTGDIASFYDIDQNIEVLHVGGINSSFPNVGIKTSAPNKTLTVVGEISATSDITTSGTIEAAILRISSAPATFINPLTASNSFLVVNINGVDKALQLWDFTS